MSRLLAKLCADENFAHHFVTTGDFSLGNAGAPETFNDEEFSYCMEAFERRIDHSLNGWKPSSDYYRIWYSFRGPDLKGWPWKIWRELKKREILY